MALTLVSTITVGSGGATSIEWTNIPQTGKNLLVLLTARATTGSGFLSSYFYLNNQEATNWSNRQLMNNSTSISAQSGSTTFMAFSNGNTSSTNSFSTVSAYVNNYAVAAGKPVHFETSTTNDTSDFWLQIADARWSNTSAVTSVKFGGNGTYAQNTVASLYIIS